MSVPVTSGLATAIRLLGGSALGAEQQAEMAETPGRWLRAMREFTSGYEMDPAKILAKRFGAGACDEMVVLRGIPFVSICEHHLLPFTGSATVGYVPQGKVVGLSKLARLVDCFALRFQIQERMTTQIAEALVEHLEPLGCGAVVHAEHSCLTCRGAKKHGAVMVTSALRGLFRTDSTARAEFLGLAR